MNYNDEWRILSGSGRLEYLLNSLSRFLVIVFYTITTGLVLWLERCIFDVVATRKDLFPDSCFLTLEIP